MSREYRVRHLRFGDGVVVGDPAVRRPLVDFGYMRSPVRRVELDWLDAAEEHQAPPVPVEPQRQSPSLRSEEVSPEPNEFHSSAKRPAAWSDNGDRDGSIASDTVSARRAILALRLGQVLEENVQEISVGADAAASSLQNAVDRAIARRPQFVLLEGPWGAGKTHLLTLLTAIARERRLASAQVTLDGEGVSLSEPMGLLEGALASLRHPAEPVPSGLANRLIKVRSEQDPTTLLTRLGHHIGATLLALSRHTFDNNRDAVDILEDYLSLSLAKTRAAEALRDLVGYRPELPTIRAHLIDERPWRFVELLEGWSEFCVLTGATGLCLVVDELDVEYAEESPWPSQIRLERRHRRQELLRVLGGLRSRKAPLLIAFGSAPLPWAEDGFGDAAGDIARHLEGTTRIQAPPMHAADTRILGERVQALYETAYGQSTGDLTPQIESFATQLLSDLNPTWRAFVRGTLELLDVATCHRPTGPGDCGS